MSATGICGCFSLIRTSLRSYTTLWICSAFLFFDQKTAYEMRISDWSSDVCSSDLVNEPQVRRVQCLPAETQGFQNRSVGRFCSAINGITQQGVPDRRHMDANLVGAPGFEPAFDQRRLATRPEPAVRRQSIGRALCRARVW